MLMKRGCKVSYCSTIILLMANAASDTVEKKKNHLAVQLVRQRLEAHKKSEDN